MVVNGVFSVVGQRVFQRSNQPPSVIVSLIDVESGSRVGAFVNPADRLATVGRGTMLRLSADLAVGNKGFVNLSNIRDIEEVTFPGKKAA